MPFHLPLPVIYLVAVLLLTAVRQLFRFPMPIWLIMSGGAVASLATVQISPLDALRSVNVDVMLFLFGMFVVGRALEESGLLLSLAYRLFGKTRRTGGLVLAVLLGAGILSAFLMNDTIAVIGTPLALYFSRKHSISPTLLLLALAFGVTTGSVMSPIGNPQNLLVALHTRMGNPFLPFFARLAVPTAVNLLLTFLALKLFFPRDFHPKELNHVEEPIRDIRLARIAAVSLILLVAMILAKIVLVSVEAGIDFRLTYIALAACAPVLLFSRRRWEVLARIDWPTLAFFVALFILMQSVWNSGFLQSLLGGSRLDTVPAILGASVAGSQLVSNVPFVALYLPLLEQASSSPRLILALAAGSTIAGNFLILGAASNVIIVQGAEAQGDAGAEGGPARLGFFTFARVGIPLTLVQLLVYWAALVLLP